MDKIDPRFKHETYERNIFATREELDKIAQIILDTSANWFKIGVNAVRVFALLAIFKIRQGMFEEEMRLGKQIYEQARARQNRGDIRDNLDGRV